VTKLQAVAVGLAVWTFVIAPVVGMLLVKLLPDTSAGQDVGRWP
jgi:hypothetical protein